MTAQTSNQPVPKVRKTLGLTGVTINAMALTAPGAFIWLLYQAQSAAAPSDGSGIWMGVLAAIGCALVTAFSLGELARRYPEAGLRSAYHFAEHVFRGMQLPVHHPWARVAKFLTGWTAHLYYWVYPGAMVAFMGILADYLLRQFNYFPTISGQIILACAFAAFIGFLALRGITGATTTSIILNTIQVTTLVFFSILAILFRFINPPGISGPDWAAISPVAVLQTGGLSNLVLQTALAVMLMAGFEASTNLAAAADNPRRDVPRGALLALVIQGVLVYLLSYFASGLAFNQRIPVPASSPAPIADLAVQVGDSLLSGNGFSLMLIIASSVVIALVAATLTAMNNGARVTFSMAMDDEMPDLLGFLHPRYATPSIIVVIMSIFSAIVGAAGLLGGLPILMGIILAANLGALVLYALLCALTIAAYAGTDGFNFFRHGLAPMVGILINLGLAAAVIVIGLTDAGIIHQAIKTTGVLASLWLIICLLYFLVKKRWV